MQTYATFTDFVRDRRADLIRFAFLLCHDLGRAEDLTQDALVKAYERWDLVATLEYPVAYVRKIIVRDYLGWRRRLASRDVLGHTGVDAGVDDSQDSHAQRAVLWQWMQQLPRRQRAVLVLRYYLDLPDDAIADLLGCAPATVRSLAARALTRLKANPTDTKDWAI